jgi:hypothetical protein
MAHELLESAINKEGVGILIVADPESGRLSMIGLNADMEDMVDLIMQALQKMKTIIVEDMSPHRTLQ